MNRDRTNIAIVEPSDLVYEGLANLLPKSDRHVFVYRAFNLDELSQLCIHEQLSLVILNPHLIINKLNEFGRLKRTFNHINWIGLVYAFFDNELLSRFYDILNILDSEESILKKIDHALAGDEFHTSDQEELTDRETEVLIQLIKGLSNKEIAEALNISIHTVISHRKNISEKTSIKSLPGLTIYAISRKIMHLNSE